MEGQERYVVDGKKPTMILLPKRLEEVADMLKSANSESMAVIPYGAGTKIDHGSPPSKVDAVLSTAYLDRIVEHEPADLTVTVEAGLPLSKLQDTLRSKGQFLPLDPPYGEKATVGGIVASNSSGPKRLRYGTARNLVLGAKVALPNGETIRAGGKNMKDVAGYDMKKLHIGAYGTLGVIVELCFRLMPIPVKEQTVLATFSSSEQALSAASSVIRSDLQPSALLFINAKANSTISSKIDHVPQVGAALAICFEGFSKAVDRQVVGVLSTLRPDSSENRILEDTTQMKLWNSVRNYSEHNPGANLLACRMIVPKARVSEAIRISQDIGESVGLECAILSDVGSGIIHTYFEGDAGGEKFTKTVKHLRHSIKGLEGYTIVEKAPIETKSAAGVWGEPDADFTIMKRLKDSFDPNGILNPGRYFF